MECGEAGSGDNVSRWRTVGGSAPRRCGTNGWHCKWTRISGRGSSSQRRECVSASSFDRPVVGICDTNMTAFSQLTYGAVLVAVLIEQLGLPIPSVVFLMAAGALSARGKMQISIILSLGILACLAADSTWFWFGRKWGSQAMRLLCRLTADPRESSRNAHEKFSRYGPRLLCVAKFFPGLSCRHSAACRRGRSVARAFPCPRYVRRLPLVRLLCRARLSLLE